MGDQHAGDADEDDVSGDAERGKQILWLICGLFVFAAFAGVANALMQPRADGFVPSLISSAGTLLIFRALYHGHEWAQTLAVSLLAFGGFVIIIAAAFLSGVVTRSWLLGLAALLTGVSWTTAVTLARNRNIQTFLRRQRENGLVDPG